MRSALHAIAAGGLAFTMAGADAQAPAGSASGDVKPAAAPVALVNPGFESDEPGILGNPKGWFSSQHAGSKSYVFALDDAVAKSGRRSFRVVNIGPEPFGMISQALPARDLRGKTLRYSAWMRTQDAKGNGFGKGGQMQIVAMRYGSPVAHNFGREIPATGTTEWTHYEVTLAVPQSADSVEVGALLFGSGTLWLDDVALEIVEEKR